ncbi:hypothetical protein RB653_009149 [Dictyostelium firmibasis]|uniref:General transcription factor 3C polypeptide 5 n=1 Tax=Dictyostelium firmibasis TaxID=79012 RepID=A0AAN7YTA8_9MYCE
MNDETNSINNNNNNNSSSLVPILVDNVRYDKAIVRPLPTKAYYGLEYPANVQNADKAIESVGGLSKISNVIKSREKEYLQLKFRPNNPTCKPTFGTKSPTCHLLLRVRPNKQPQQDTNFDNDEAMNSPKPLPTPTSNQKQQESEKFDATIIALVPSTIRFDGLCDFQYLIKSDTKSSYTDNNASSTTNSSTGVTTKQQKDQQYYVQQYSDNNEIMKDEPMNLIPPLFSRIDFPQNYLFKSNPNAQFDQSTKQFVFSKPSARKVTGLAKFSNNAIPIAPQDLPKVFGVNELMKKTRDILVELFDKRPIWLYISLLDRVQKEGGLVAHTKRLLPSLAFNFIDGPWRKCWVRLGFDPRIHPETSQYQTIDFRISEQESHFASNQSLNNNNKELDKNKEKDTSKENKEKEIDKDTSKENKESGTDDISNKNDNDDNNTENKVDDENGDNNGKNNKNTIEKKTNDDNANIIKNKEEKVVDEVQKVGRGQKDEKLIIQNGVNGETKVNPSRKKLLEINTFEFNSQQQSQPPSSQAQLLLKSADEPQDFYQPPAYDYTFKTAPAMLSNLYQIVDIEEPSIADYWASVKIESTCQKRFGWFSESSFREGIERMKARFGVMDSKMRFKSRSNPNMKSTTKTTQLKETKSKGRLKKNTTTTPTKKDKNNENNNEDDKMDTDETNITKSNKEKEIDESLKNDSLAQMEKDNEYLHEKDGEIEMDSDVVGGFDDDDDEDKPFELLDDFDGTDNIQMKQIDDFFGNTQTNEDSEEEEDEEEEEEEEEEDSDFDFDESE